MSGKCCKNGDLVQQSNSRQQMMTVKINLYFLLGFTRTTSSELIRWYDEICPRRLVSSIGKHSPNLSERKWSHLHTVKRRYIGTYQISMELWKKYLRVVHVIAVGSCICINEKRNSYLRPIAPVFLAVLAWWFFFFLHLTRILFYARHFAFSTLRLIRWELG